MNSRNVACGFLLLFVAAFAPHAAAQSTILNTPSTDVVAPKKVYVEMDFITNYAWQRDDDSKYANYAPRLVVGVARNLEAGVNVSFTHVPGGGQPIELQPNAKWQFYQNEQKGIAGAAGCILYLPITHRAGTDTVGQCYSVVRKSAAILVHGFMAAVMCWLGRAKLNELKRARSSPTNNRFPNEQDCCLIGSAATIDLVRSVRVFTS